MKIISLLAAATLGLTLCACGGSSGTAGVPSTGIPSSVQLTAVGYSLSVFAPAQGVLRPDDILQMGTTVFVVYQDNNNLPNGTLAPGAASAQSEVIEFDTNGNILQTFDVPGHPDG